MIGYVYLIGNSIFGWYKIGKSKTPEVRVKNLGILLPFKIEVCGVWKVQNYSSVETTLHEIYKEHLINGEWFEFNIIQINSVFENMKEAIKIYPSDNITRLDKFSNIEEDIKKSKKVVGVKTQKLRGNYTDSQREQIKLDKIAENKKNKELGFSNRGHLKCPVCESFYKLDHNFCVRCGTPVKEIVEKCKLQQYQATMSDLWNGQ